MNRARHLLLVPLAVLAVVLVGCGNDDESADSTSTSTTEATSDTTGDAEITPPTGVPDFASEECQELGEALQNDLGTSLTSGSNPTESLEQAATTFENAVDSAPEAIKDDMAIIAELYRQLATTSADIDWDAVNSGDPTAAVSAGQLFADFSANPDFPQAVQNVSAYAQESCTAGG